MAKRTRRTTSTRRTKKKTTGNPGGTRGRTASTARGRTGSGGRTGARGRAATQKQASAYKHPESDNPMRPEVGTQAQFKKKKPPKTYRYDSSLAPELNWDGQNPAREQGERELSVISCQLSAVRGQLHALREGLMQAAEQAHRTGNTDVGAAIERLLADNWPLTTGNLAKAAEAAARLIAMSRPFLNWAGKAERLSFDVPTLPLFIHERLSTKAIIETLKSHRRDKQMTFGDLFNDPQHSITDQVLKAYEYRDNWVNRMILGDSLVVMNSLLEYEGLGGQVQMIYMDPPYGVKYASNFQPFVRRRDVKHNDDDSMTREPEMVQAYRDTWELGLHSYLTYLRDRFVVARELLAPTGSIFVQISDENLHVVAQLMSEVFGSENAVSIIAFRVKSPLGVKALGRSNDFLVWYAKDRSRMTYNQLYVPKDVSNQPEFNMIELPDGTRLSASECMKRHGLIPTGGRYFTAQNLASSGYTESCTYNYTVNGKTYGPPRGKSWKTHRDGMDSLLKKNRLHPLSGSLRFVYYLDDFPVQELSNFWTDTFAEGDKAYVVQTSPLVIQRCMLMTTLPGDLVLDPTCGSGTTAYVAEQWGRRWITIDTSRVPLSLARQRLLTATFPYYELADETRGPAGGFAYRRKQNSKGEEVGGIVPHITLKSIANNEPPKEEVLVDRPEVVRNIVRVGGPFVVEATIPTPVDWEGEESSVVSGQLSEEARDDHGAFVDRMLEILRKSPVLRVEGGRSVTLSQVRPPARALSLSAEAMVQLSVASGQLSGAPNGTGVSGPRGVAKGNDAGDGSIQGDAEVSRRRAVRTDEPDAAGGRVDSEQHRRGARAAESGGVSAIPGPGAREPVRVGDADRDRGQSRTAGSERGKRASRTGGGGGADPQWTSGEPSLTTDSRQLTTLPVAIVFGPESGAVSEKLVYDAAREAHAKGYAHLYVIGFAIQPNARQLVENCRDVVGVPASYIQMTPDVMMGDLLKNMRSSQIFSVCGLPEISVRRLTPAEVASGQLSAVRPENRQRTTDDRSLTIDNWYQVELLGLDVFDPATMENDHRPGRDVPAWFLDTDYNDLCFHVCQAFFPRTSAWENLKRALRGTYEESVWDHLAGTKSAPFQAGEKRQITIKVVDDRGNELMVVKSTENVE